jgi:hypothetical protein
MGKIQFATGKRGQLLPPSKEELEIAKILREHNVLEGKNCEWCKKPLFPLERPSGSHITIVYVCHNIKCQKCHNPQGYIMSDGSYLRSRFLELPEGITVGEKTE